MPTKRVALTRRALLKGAGALALAPYVAASLARGGEGAAAPSNRIALGFIGIGAMGQGHLRCCLDLPEAQIVGVCDVDRWRREHAKAAVETRYAEQRPGGQYRGCEAYTDLRDLLARDDIDAVIIATGDRWHALATSLAVKAGKDVYCEKPVSLTVRQARAMVDVVRRYGRVFQGGLQQRSSGEFIRACDLVRAGAIGKVRVVYVNHPGTVADVDLPAEPVPDGLDWDLWLGPALWHPYNSRFHPYGRPPARSHHQNWFDCIRTRHQPASDVESACRSTIVSHLGCIAHWTGRSLAWDPAREVFPDDAEACRWLARAMRSPWHL